MIKPNAAPMPKPPTSRYLTDGTQLYRVIAEHWHAPGGPYMLLEDCRTLMTSTYPLNELLRRRMRNVATTIPGRRPTRR
jgi:hypothetical protein